MRARVYETGPGRVILTVFFIIYCFLYGMAIHSIPAGTNDKLSGFYLFSLCLTTVLYGAMWLGQNWARYVYLGLLLLKIVLSLTRINEFKSAEAELPVYAWILLPYNFVVFFTLCYAPAIRALMRLR